MTTVTCSACGLENAIPEGTSVDQFACASCMALLPTFVTEAAAPLALPVVPPAPDDARLPLYIRQQ